MPGIKIEDIAYVRFRAPDLDLMETFLGEFGLGALRAAPTRSTCAELAHRPSSM